MSTYRTECDKCSTVTLTESWEPEHCLACRVAELEEERRIRREQEPDRMLDWRGIDPVDDLVCTRCGGSGVTAYGSTSTWRGGAGGQTITRGVCDRCWGSGIEDRPWTNLHKVDSWRASVDESKQRVQTAAETERNEIIKLVDHLHEEWDNPYMKQALTLLLKHIRARSSEVK